VSDFVHDPTPVVAVVNTPQGSVMVTQENSDMVHRTPDQTAEEMQLKAKQAEEVTKLQETHQVDNAKIAEGTPLEQVPVVHYRASTVSSDKGAVNQLFAEHKISEEDRDERLKEIDRIAKEAEKTEKDAQVAADKANKDQEKELKDQERDQEKAAKDHEKAVSTTAEKGSTTALKTDKS
jgi:hypothetical protein